MTTMTMMEMMMMMEMMGRMGKTDRWLLCGADFGRGTEL